MRIEDFEFDDYNEDEMWRHGVTPREVLQVLDRGDYRIYRNKGIHADRQPYVMEGPTYGGRVLRIPIKPLDDTPGVWRPATAYEPG